MLRTVTPAVNAPAKPPSRAQLTSTRRCALLSRSGALTAAVLWICATLCFQCAAQTSVTTYHNNKQRTGANILETILTPSNVTPSTFGKLFSQPVDGFVYAQPLYVPNVTVPGLGVHNVVYVATMNDSVYAFDADSKTGTNVQPLWQMSFLNPTLGITAVPSVDMACSGLISAKIGIMSTPVIDTVGGTIYVVARTKESGQYVQRLHALDITTGAEKFGGPVAITATVPGTGIGSVNGMLTFDPKIQNQRAALLLQNGLVYIAWGSHCDQGAFHGWLMGYDYKQLVQRVVWVTTPNGVDGAIWESGSGPAADSKSVYIPIANGTFDVNTGGSDYGQSIVKLSPPTAGVLTVQDYFTPFNGPNLNNGDWDIGSGGAMLLNDQPLGPHLHLLLQSDKKGNVYLIDRDNMGQYDPLSNHAIVQSMPAATKGMWNSPAWWSNHIYLGGGGDTLKAFALNPVKGLLAPVPTSQTTKIFNYPGTTPSVSANQTKNAIVWALDNSLFKAPSGNAVLYAYDATNLANELYDSNQNLLRDNPGLAVKFTVPTIANGKVYVGTRNRISVYGLLPVASTKHSRSKPAKVRRAGFRDPSPSIPSSSRAVAEPASSYQKPALMDNP